MGSRDNCLYIINRIERWFGSCNVISSSLKQFYMFIRQYSFEKNSLKIAYIFKKYEKLIERLYNYFPL